MRLTSCKILGSNSCVYQLPRNTYTSNIFVVNDNYIIQYIASKSIDKVLAPCILFIAKANKVGQRIKQRNEREMLRSIFFTIHMRITLPRFKVKIGHANNLLESDYSTIFA